MEYLKLDIAESDIEKMLEPYIVEHYAESSPAWAALVEENAKRQRRHRLKRQLLGWIPKLRRTQAGLQKAYSLMWREVPIEEQLRRDGPAACYVWKGHGLRVPPIAYKRVHLLFIVRLIEQLRPATVLEVGSGNGLNLFVLSGRFPGIRFTGVEFTHGGVLATETIRSGAHLPQSISNFSPVPLQDASAFRRINVVQGNAAALPFRDRSFDLVYTSLALEQMEEIRTEALAEIRRVARAHTAMIEPFREWNESGSQRDYIVANDYFSGRIADLPGIGLEPLLATVDMPTKLTFRPGLVVCRVR